MALRLRRGTDAERQLITPVQGELIYTTDTKLLYVGDGSTAGGTLVSGVQNLSNLLDVDVTGATDGQVLAYDTDLEKWVATDNVAGTSISSIFDLDDVFTDGSPLDVGNILRWDGLNFTPAPITEIFQEQQNYKINIVGDDSTILVDTDTNTFTGVFVGDGSGLTGITGTGVSSIFDLDDVFTDGSPLDTGNILRWDGLNFTPAPISEVFQEQQNYKINIVGDDSTILVDTDTNTFTGVFVGDGSGLTNVAGASVSSIFDLDDVFTDGSLAVGNILRWDGLNFTPAPISEVFQEQQNYKINIVGDDSTILVDTDTNTFTGEFIGNVIGDVRGNVTGDLTGIVVGSLLGTVDGDVKGSIFGDDSRLLVDAVNSLIPAEVIEGTFTGNVIGDIRGSVFGDDTTLIIDGISSELIINSATINSLAATTASLTQVDDRALLSFIKSTASDISASPDFLGTLFFQRDDANGLATPSLIIGGNSGIYMAHNITGTQTEADYLAYTSDGLGIGTFFPAAKLDVKGNAIITGGLTADLTGSVFADDSTLLVDAVNGTIPGYISIAELQTALQDGAGDFTAFKSYILGLS